MKLNPVQSTALEIVRAATALSAVPVGRQCASVRANVLRCAIHVTRMVDADAGSEDLWEALGELSAALSYLAD